MKYPAGLKPPHSSQRLKSSSSSVLISQQVYSSPLPDRKLLSKRGQTYAFIISILLIILSAFALVLGYPAVASCDSWCNNNSGGVVVYAW
jgi:hypothetical protein